MDQLGGEGYPIIYLCDSLGVVEEYYEFSSRDIGRIQKDFPEDLDGPIIPLDSGKRKKYRKGFLPMFQIVFLFDNDNTGMSKDSIGDPLNDCQTFLMNLVNHSNIIKVKPHSDKAQEYECFLNNGWKWKSVWQRTYGYRGIMEFEGTDIITALNFT